MANWLANLGNLFGGATKYAGTGVGNVLGNLFGGGGSLSGKVTKAEPLQSSGLNVAGIFPQRKQRPPLSPVNQSPSYGPFFQTAGRWPGLSGTSQSKGWFQDLFGGATKGNMLGMGITALGGLMRPPSQVPQTTPSMEQLRALSQSGGGPMGQRASSELEGLMNQQFQPMNQVEEDAIRRSYQLDRTRRIKELQDRYRSARYGTDYTTDTQYKQDENFILNELANQENAALARGRRQISQDFQSNRLAQILAARGIDTSNTQIMSQLALLDLGQLQAQLGIDRTDAYYLKDLLTQLGGRFLPQPQMNLMSLFGGQPQTRMAGM